MRISSSFNLRTLELKAALVSLLCHLIFIKFFMVTFSLQPAEFKPAFRFLGPILTDNDFRFQELATKKPAASLPSTLQDLTVSDHGNDLGAQRNLSKPVFSNPAAQQKAFLKSTFIKPSETGKKERLEDLGIDLSVPQRVPLKLDLK
jgi:hypothetical protein